MSRIAALFAAKNEPILNVYCTAGFPALNDTLPVMEALQSSGADLIELGMPYSDPLADGPVIQASSMVALQQGMTIPVLFSQIRNMRDTIHVPVVLMGYMNPVMQYGFAKFCADAAAAGVDGLILPDLPVVEFETEYAPVIHQHGLDFIFLITPETSKERIQKLDSLSSGFLYAVSSSSTTGSDRGNSGMPAYLQQLQQLHLKNPVLVGFGIKDKTSFEAASQYTRGAIIGSAYIKALQGNPDVKNTTKSFLAGIKG